MEGPVCKGGQINWPLWSFLSSWGSQVHHDKEKCVEEMIGGGEDWRRLVPGLTRSRSDSAPALSLVEIFSRAVTGGLTYATKGSSWLWGGGERWAEVDAGRPTGGQNLICVPFRGLVGLGGVRPLGYLTIRESGYFLFPHTLWATPLHPPLTPSTHWAFAWVHCFTFSTVSFSWDCSLFRLASLLSKGLSVFL